MAYPENNNNGEIKDIPEVPMLGAEGGLGLVSGIVGRIGKAFLNTAKQYLRKPAASQQTARNFKSFHRDGVTYDTKMINDAFKQRFGSPKPKVSPPQQNVISSSTVDRASKMRNIERGNIGNTPRWAKPPVKK